MFSIAAINDVDSKSEWEPLAPTKEAQEFHLSQIYHEGLDKLQAKDYDKARELFESVLKDPLVANVQVDNSGIDGHLLQLRFLVLKNLATVFLQQGSGFNEYALRCYLQAAEIDTNDSVVWNHLGTLSCSMGLLSISRWAFEQGLSCSPNNWNCMEKLLEVLIAIGDEVACLSVAELILRHWPSHSRALHVKSTIEESDPIPFAPKGIDKLEPKHLRLEFPQKRKATDDLVDGVPPKKLKTNIEVKLPETSWNAIVGELLHILTPLFSANVLREKEEFRSGDISISIQLPHPAGDVSGSMEHKGSLFTNNGEIISICNSDKSSLNKDKETTIFEEQPQERRSSRLERLRSRKPRGEDSDFAAAKDAAKVAMQFLKPFIAGGGEACIYGTDASSSSHCSFMGRTQDSEGTDIINFVQKTSNNYGAYHMGHLLLEEIADRGIYYQDSNVRLLDLEKFTRQWGQERTPHCSLFLAELYYDFGVCSSGSLISDFMSEVSYHLCKIIEAVATEYPLEALGVAGNDDLFMKGNSSSACQILNENTFPLKSNHKFWVRFYWLSGRLSIIEGNKVKARDELSLSFSLMNIVNKEDSTGFICLPHCKAIKKLTAEKILHEINLLEIDLLLKKTVPEMMEKNMYSECVDVLAPLLFSSKDVHPDIVSNTGTEKGFTSVELSAVDVLISACEKIETMDTEVLLNCHKRKLQILLTAAGLGSYPDSDKREGLNHLSSSETESKDNSCKQGTHMVVEEIKAISDCVSQIKSNVPLTGQNAILAPATIIDDIQFLLLAFVCNLANTCFLKKSSGIGASDNEQDMQCNFIDAAITFCKLQHLNPTVPIKTQTDLIVSMHDMLAEFGLCCAHGSDDKEAGTFLKLAIKHLLSLHMKLKSNFQSLNRVPEKAQHDQQSLHNNTVQSSEQICNTMNAESSVNDANFEMLNPEAGQVGKDGICIEEKDVGRKTSECVPSQNCPEKEEKGLECEKDVNDNPNIIFNDKEKPTESGKGMTEDEREELELAIDTALDQCFYCLYGLNLRSDPSYEDDLAMHKNTSRGDYQTKEQCADVFQYILPYAKASSRTGLVKLRRVLRAIRKHFPHPPDQILVGNAIDKFLDDPDLCEDRLSEEAGSTGFMGSMLKVVFADPGGLTQLQGSLERSSEPYWDVYCNLYYFLALSEEMSATDKWAGFVLTKEGEEFVEQNARLFKYDLLYNPLRFESWERLANIYDEEVDLLLNDGSKQINVLGWRKNATLPQRVETSRRRSRRCFLMTLALAKTAIQQGEIHELLALVYYDGIQNVVPFYDQRSIIPSKDATWMSFCENSMRHFKKAFERKEDWSHAFYLGKLSEKLGYSQDVSLSYYAKAISLNPSAVDPFYRMHASRLKLLCSCEKRNPEALKVIASHCFMEETNQSVMSTFADVSVANLESSMDAEQMVCNGNSDNNIDPVKLEEVWNMLYDDCLSALEICVEGDLKHFHKARYMLAQGLYRRDSSRNVEKAKEELSFCFKSTRSSFTINMWEIDSMVKKGRRKTPGVSGNRKLLEVNLPESSRKFITCIRKYILFYLKLLEETGEISILDRAYISLRADKRFSLCLEDIVPVALGRYMKTLILSIRQGDNGTQASGGSTEHFLEKIFSLFLDQVNLWSDICSLPEIKSPELTESCLYGYLYDYIQLLEKNLKVEALEGINEKIRKRLKNPKLSSSNCAKVYKTVSVAWCRSLVISMALITPLHSRLSREILVPGLVGSGLENTQLLCVDLQTDELWSSSSEDQDHHLKSLEAKWNPSLSKIKNVIIKRVSDEDLENAAVLLRSSYNFYKDTSCALLPSGINLYMVPSQLATETYVEPGIGGVDILDMNTSRKLLLWGYTLLHGYCPGLSTVIKYCEENVKSRMKRGAGTPLPPNTSPPSATASNIGGGGGGGGIKEGISKSNETDSSIAVAAAAAATSSMLEIDCGQKMPSAITLAETGRNTLNLASETSEEGMCSSTPASFLENGSTNLLRHTSPSPLSSSIDIQITAKKSIIDLNQSGDDPSEEGNGDSPRTVAAAVSNI